MRYALKNKETEIVENIIEVESADSITTTFIKDALGNKHPTSTIDGELQMTSQYLVPDGYELVETDEAIIGETWPLPPKPEPEEEVAADTAEPALAQGAEEEAVADVAPTKKSKKTT